MAAFGCCRRQRGARWLGVARALVLLAPLLGCASAAEHLPPIAAPVEKAYLLGPGDRLRISVFGEAAASGEFTVSADGKVAAPLIGELTAGGRTLAQLQQAYREALERGFYKNPKVAVEVVAYRPFYIMGEVKKPGSYPYASGLTVSAAVAEAGGFTPHADRDIAVIERKTPSGMRRGRARGETPVMPDDIINIPQTIF